MDNDELLKNIMQLNVAIARMESQQLSLKEMITSDFSLIQKEQNRVIGKVETMEKNIKQMQEDSRHELELKYELAKEEFNKIKVSLETRIKALEIQVDENKTFKIQIMAIVGFLIGVVAFGGQVAKILGW